MVSRNETNCTYSSELGEELLYEETENLGYKIE
jgi:hypothetical protein